MASAESEVDLDHIQWFKIGLTALRGHEMRLDVTLRRAPEPEQNRSRLRTNQGSCEQVANNFIIGPCLKCGIGRSAPVNTRPANVVAADAVRIPFLQHTQSTFLCSGSRCQLACLLSPRLVGCDNFLQPRVVLSRWGQWACLPVIQFSSKHRVGPSVWAFVILPSSTGWVA